MSSIDKWSDAKLRKLYRDVMAQCDPFKESPHAGKSRVDLVREMDAADNVMSDMSAEILRPTKKNEDLNDALDRVLIYRKMLFVLLCLAVIAAAVGWWPK